MPLTAEAERSEAPSNVLDLLKKLIFHGPGGRQPPDFSN